MITSDELTATREHFCYLVSEGIATPHEAVAYRALLELTRRRLTEARQDVMSIEARTLIDTNGHTTVVSMYDNQEGS